MRSKVGGKDTALHGKIDGLLLNVLTLTHKTEGVKDDIHEIREDQAEMKADIRKAVNDRAEIKERIGHLEGRSDVPRSRR